MEVDFAQRIGCLGSIPLEVSKKITSRLHLRRCGQSPTNPANFVANRLVDVEILGLTETRCF